MKYKTLTTLLLFLVVTALNAQSIKKGVRKYDKLRYKKSIANLSPIAEKPNPPSEVLEKLANAYYFNNMMEEAAKWYDELLNKHEPSTAEVYYRYAMSLKTLLDYKEAKKWMSKFAEAHPDDSRAIMFKANPNYLENISNLSGNYELAEVDFNSSVSDFGTSFYKDGIVFASARGKGRLYKWNEQPFLNLYYKENEDALVKELSKKINTKFHESSTCFTKDGNTIYFTRNNYYKGKENRSKARVTGLKIYTATLKDGVWGNIKPLPFSDGNYNMAHPALSPDGTKLYFSSDMPGTLGKSDIFVVNVSNDGENVTYSRPENLGPTVNTSGRENFPFVSDNGTLYFSSDGHPGLGGLDVFKMNLEQEGAKPLNVGKPVNSSFDDFEFIIDDEKEIGYFTSNRKGGLGDDDIYKIKTVKCEVKIDGKVIDKLTKEPISNATVVVYEAEGEEVQRFTTDADGVFNYKTDCVQSNAYRIKVDKEEYNPYANEFIVNAKQKEPIVLEVNLDKPEPEPEPVKVAEIGTDLFKLLNMNPIYFDLNKFNIRPDAQLELQKVVNYMLEYPTVKIDVRSHTDARGSDKYNLSLSKRRNAATKNWIVSKGIMPERISGEGYGETQILNHCTNGVKCIEELHEQNRRSEFIVTAN